jgi:predicted hydrocarbon binding protein/predicted amino acid-binding ACT domain protein
MVTITISGADKSGALARISAFLVRKGYALKGQQLMDSASGGKLVRISLDAPQIDRSKLAAEIKGLGAEFSLVGLDIAPSGSAPTVKEIAEKFPDIGALVPAYAESFGADAREAELLQAGKKIGAYCYEKEWSFGSPLKMPTALKRTLVPALEGIGKVEATDTEVHFPDSPLCSGGTACCDFLAGFMQGFLDAGPLTANTKVAKASCKARGGARCSFKIQYDL